MNRADDNSGHSGAQSSGTDTQQQSGPALKAIRDRQLQQLMDTHTAARNDDGDGGGGGVYDNNSDDRGEEGTSESTAAAAADDDDDDGVDGVEQKKMNDRFKYLLRQTEIFSHFMTNASSLQSGSKQTRHKGKEKRTVVGKRSLMSEKEEDEEILREALEEEDVGSGGVSRSGSGGGGGGGGSGSGGHQITRLSVSPSYIRNTQLRAYQLEGLNWMVKLYDNGINGILADEMGLGKTIQTISLIGFLKHYRAVSGPHMVIAPKSVITNWMNEMQRWCPEIRALKFHGSKDERRAMREEQLVAGRFDVCVTSYEIAIREKAALNKFQWRCLIIDEAHRIKNENSILSRCVRMFSSQFRLLITGTPLQNNLHELWALLNFLLPEVFDSAEDFDAWFNLKEGRAQTEIVDQLHKVLKPFMLRRLKSDVEHSLPPKKEIYVECGMSSMQKEWYRKLLTKDVMALKSAGGEKVKLLNIVMQLRKCCNHPYLFEGAEPGPPYTTDVHLINNSGKMVLLDRLLAKLKAQGSRVLIFTQMARQLDILEDYCFLRQYKYCRIDGQTESHDREAYMEEFNREGSDKFIFLLTTRAGGLGINLATADTVIIYDSDWNPQADLQAQDRAHRIGQKKPVNVYRLITKDSIEEKIYQRAVKKLYLDAVVIQQGRLAEQNTKLSRAELMQMVRFGAEEVFRSTESTITDEDIDLILQRGEVKSKEIDEQYKSTYAQNNLLNFSLSEDANLYEFEGMDYSQKPTTSLVVSELPDDATEETLHSELGEQSKSLADDILISRKKKSAILYFKSRTATAQVLDLLTNRGYKAKFCKKNDTFIKQLEEFAAKENPERTRSRLRYTDLDSRAHSLHDKRSTQTTFSQPNIGPRYIKYADFQFVDQERLDELWRKERDAAIEQYERRKKKRERMKLEMRRGQQQQERLEDGESAISDSSAVDVEANASSSTPDADENISIGMEMDQSDTEDEKEPDVLTEEETRERTDILSRGFVDWSRKDFMNFIKGCETFGRDNIAAVAPVVEGKTFEEVLAYSKVFWARYAEIADHDRYIRRISRGEEQLNKIERHNKLLQWKTKKYPNPWSDLKFNYGQNKGKQYTEEEDRFLVCITAQIGYGDWKAVRLEIRRSWQFRFDWFFKTRTPQELQRRVDSLLRILDREHKDEVSRLGQSSSSSPSRRGHKRTSDVASDVDVASTSIDVDDEVSMASTVDTSLPPSPLPKKIKLNDEN